jgi:hypothetical protein
VRSGHRRVFSVDFWRRSAVDAAVGNHRKLRRSSERQTINFFFRSAGTVVVRSAILQQVNEDEAILGTEKLGRAKWKKGGGRGGRERAGAGLRWERENVRGAADGRTNLFLSSSSLTLATNKLER